MLNMIHHIVIHHRRDARYYHETPSQISVRKSISRENRKLYVSRYPSLTLCERDETYNFRLSRWRFCIRSPRLSHISLKYEGDQVIVFPFLTLRRACREYKRRFTRIESFVVGLRNVIPTQELHTRIPLF